MDLHEKYHLRRVINACGKMTSLCGAIVLPEIIEPVSQALRHFFNLDEIQAAAGKLIAQASGAENGCVTACTAAGITLSVAACMTRADLGKVLQLPNTEGIKSRVLIQKGHCVNYGAPITQAIHLAGAQVVEVGVINRCREEEIQHELNKGEVAAIVAVESHHTVRYGWIPARRLSEIAHQAGVPLILDGAAQDWRIKELVQWGADLVITSAHKFLCSTTAGVVAGRKDLVDAVYLQNQGIGRGMKAGKEAIFGVIAALEHRMKQDVRRWTAEQDRKVELILSQLRGTPEVALQVDPDPNGCPFSRVRITVNAPPAKHDAASLTRALSREDPMIVVRAHHVDEGYIHLDAIEMTDKEILHVCDRVKAVLAPN